MSELKKVTVDQLNHHMRIISFIGFAQNYRPLNEKTCQFLKINFKGASFIVKRKGSPIECSSDKLVAGDEVLKAHKFPQSLHKLTVVSDRLIPELKRRGFTHFEVQLVQKKPSGKQIEHQKAVDATNEFVTQVKETIESRDNASNAIRDMMDNARLGKIDASAVKKHVDDILEKSSGDAIKTLAVLKQSDQTYAHCIDAGGIFQSAYYAMKKLTNQPSIFKDPNMAMFAAFMHDCGKSKVPKDILESTVRFERGSREMNLLQNHTVFGAEILTGMKMPDYIVNIAHYHHVKMQSQLNSSYPKGATFDNAIMETRLASIVDVYQALIGRRSYKKSWPPAAAIRYIDALVGVEFDPVVWDQFVKVMGKYPVGSLVELNDASLAFVVNVPVDLDRPQVIVVRDSEGESPTFNSLIDLTEEKDVSITKDLDHYEVFGEDALNVFTNAQVK